MNRSWLTVILALGIIWTLPTIARLGSVWESKVEPAGPSRPSRIGWRPSVP